MHKLFTFVFLFSSFLVYSSISVAQENGAGHVVHVQTWTLKSIPSGDDGTAFNDMLKRQAQVINSDSRVVAARVLRHFWGADSRDLIIITEFANPQDLFAFYDELDSKMEAAFSKEELEKDDELWNNYVGHHSDEVYAVVAATSK